MPAAVEWTPELVDRICDEVSSGRGIAEVAAEGWCPSEPTIYRKMARDPEFAALIGAARVAQQDYEVESCVKMADEATPEDWQVVKLRIWARQWRASKLAPKRYGDRVAHDHGGQAGNPIKTEATAIRVDADALSPDERAALLKAVHKRMQGAG